MAEKVRKLRLGWLWASEDQWMLHRTTKDGLWKALQSDSDPSIIDMIRLLHVKEEWIEIRPEDKIPINYPLFLFAWKEYLKRYRKMNPPLAWRLAIKPAGIFILTLYKEDSAYCERFGGVVQYILDHKDDWPKDNKETRLMALRDTRDWWYEEDWRERGKDKLLRLANKIINLYDTEPFIQKTVDFMIDTLIANEKNWNPADGFFKPERWYPRGKGQVNYLCHGRRS